MRIDKNIVHIKSFLYLIRLLIILFWRVSSIRNFGLIITNIRGKKTNGAAYGRTILSFRTETNPIVRFSGMYLSTRFCRSSISRAKVGVSVIFKLEPSNLNR